MKVKNLSATPIGVAEDFPLSRRSGASDARQSFERHMSTSAGELYEEHLAELAVKIDDQGKLLAQRADMGEMERYRTLIAELISEVVGNAYAFRKERTIDARGRLKLCATVNKINEKLEDLAREILAGNKNTLEIISKIDDIRGLIVDIMT